MLRVFSRQSQVVNGASEFLVKVLGNKGKHPSCALSCNILPNNSQVELVMILEVEE